MKILLLSEPTYPRHPGGAGKSSHVLAAGLAARGHRVRVLCECHERDEVEVLEGVEVHRVNLGRAQAAGSAEREAAIQATFAEYVRKRILPEGVDVVYDSGGFLSFFFHLATDLKLHHGVAFVLHYRYLITRHQAAVARPRFDPYAGVRLRLEGRISETTQCYPARFADMVVCPSESDAAFVQASYRPAAGKPVVLPEPVQFFPIAREAVQSLRAELGPPDAKFVLFGGRIDSALKGPEVVSSAFEQILAARPSTRLLLASLPQPSRAFKRRFGDAAMLVSWVVERPRMATLLAAAHVVVFPSYYESFGMMCAEALAAGTPVVASPVAGMRDIVVHGSNGFLLREDVHQWPRQLAEFVLRILEDPELEARMREQAVLSARRLAVEIVAERAEQICEEAVRRNRSRRPVTYEPPQLEGQERARYLAALAEFTGPGHEHTGEAVLANWKESAEGRCGRCTRETLARGVRGLVVLRRPSPSQWLARARGNDPIREAVERVCPLALLQHDLQTA